MRKIATWTVAIAFLVALIDWGMMGVKLLNHDYNITAEAYVGLGCWVMILVCILCRAFTDRCPHCGKIRAAKGAYCSCCGRKID